MGLIDDIRQKGAEGRLTEEALYAEVLREMETGIRRDGLWAKALSEAGGEEAPSKARYIKLRVQSLRDEVAIALSEHKKQGAGVVAQDDESLRRANLRRAIKEETGQGSFSAMDDALGSVIVFVGVIAAVVLVSYLLSGKHF